MDVSTVTFLGGSQKSAPGKRTGRQRFQVIMTGTPEPGDAEKVRVASAGGVTIPARGDNWSATDTALKCTGVETGEPTDLSAQAYNVTAEYETGSAADENENPLEEPDTWALDFTSSSEPKYTDRDGAAITNSAGQTFDPPVIWEVEDPVVTVVRNIAIDEFDLSTTCFHNNKINSDAFDLLGESINPGVARVHISARKATKNDIDYVQLTFIIALRPDGWDKNVLDEGTLKLVGGEPTVILDPTGLPLNAPVKLDGAGGVLADGDPAEYITAKGYQEVAFADFNLPATA